MRTFLFSWNPDKWPWDTMAEDTADFKNGKIIAEKWSCASHKAMQKGDRAFFIRVAKAPKGIFASGYITSQPFQEPRHPGHDKLVYRVEVTYDVLLNPYAEEILGLDLLELGQLQQQQWTPQSAGISIRPHLVNELEAVWDDFLNIHHIKALPLNKNQWK